MQPAVGVGLAQGDRPVFQATQVKRDLLAGRPAPAAELDPRRRRAVVGGELEPGFWPLDTELTGCGGSAVGADGSAVEGPGQDGVGDDAVTSSPEVAVPIGDRRRRGARTSAKVDGNRFTRREAARVELNLQPGWSVPWA